MIDRTLLQTAALIEIILFGCAVALIFGHAALLAARHRWTQPLLDEARRELAAALRSEDEAQDRLPAVRALPPALQMRLFLDLAASLAGEQRAVLGDIAGRLHLVQRAVTLCGSRFPVRRLYGARLLSAVGAGHPIMVELLRDPHVAVRAQAAEAVLYHPDPAAVEQLVLLLKDPAALCRFTARDTLLRLEGRPLDALAAFLAAEEDEVALTGALDVATGLAEPRFLTIALERARSGPPEIRTRAVGLLAAIGGAAAVDALETLLHDAVPEVRAAAAAGLGHLGHWRAGPDLAALLRDNSWDVRRAAGLALRTLGSPGELLLRRALRDADALTADMARHILDLPRAVVPLGRAGA